MPHYYPVAILNFTEIRPSVVTFDPLLPGKVIKGRILFIDHCIECIDCDDRPETFEIKPIERLHLRSTVKNLNIIVSHLFVEC